MGNNLQTILLIQFDIFKHEEKEWNKIIFVSKLLNNNLQTMLIQFFIFKREKEWDKIIFACKYCIE